MTKEQINIAIAEAQGWKFIPPLDKTFSPNCWEHENFPTVWEVYPCDYYNDLNAMHEVWCSLTPKQHQTFRRELQITVAFAKEDNLPYKGPCHSVCNATALQRAEAYLRTIGKWKEE